MLHQLRICCAALVLVTWVRAASPPAEPAQTVLATAMAARLDLSREVAWIKYRDSLPVRDPRREAEVLDRMAALATARGMDATAVREFFAAQIAASRAEQERLIRLWKRGAPLPAVEPRSLRTDVRRDIDSANLALLDALAQTTRPTRAAAASSLRGKDFDARVVKLAVGGYFPDGGGH